MSITLQDRPSRSPWKAALTTPAFWTAVAVFLASVVTAVVVSLRRSEAPTPPTAQVAPPRNSTAGGGPVGPPGSWTLVFDEEFNGTALDASKWNANWLGDPGVPTPPVNSGELANYSPANVSVSGGLLHLTALDQPSTAEGETRPYTSGMVNTFGHYEYTYGYAEARIYVPGEDGTVLNWPAFWTDGTGPWPNTGENDIMEGGRGVVGFHFTSSVAGIGQVVKGDFTGWHTFGADWEPGSVTYYYDGKSVGSITNGITDSPMYLIINLAVGGPYSGRVSLPSTLMVDYVKVWQH